MSRRYCLAIALGFLALLVSSQAVTAIGYEKKVSNGLNTDVVLQPGDYQALIVHLNSGDKMSLEVRVGAGEDIDVYTMAIKDYQDYKSPTSVQFGYFAQFSKERMKYLVYPMDFAPSDTGDYVVVLDNVQKTPSGAAGAGVVTISVNMNVKTQAPFPWWIVGVVIAVIIAVGVVAFFYQWRKVKAIEIDEAERQRKRMEASKVRPIFIQQQAAPGAPGAPGAAAAPVMMTAAPPSSSCKACPHVYDPTSANCIACEYR